jgi:hypothetical protein
MRNQCPADPNYLESDLPVLYKDMKILQKPSESLLEESACHLSALRAGRTTENVSLFTFSTLYRDLWPSGAPVCPLAVRSLSGQVASRRTPCRVGRDLGKAVSAFSNLTLFKTPLLFTGLLFQRTMEKMKPSQKI